MAAVLWGVVAAAPLVLALAWMLKTTFPPVRGLVNLVVDQLGPLLARCSTAELALLAAMAGLSEEVLFRGVIQTGLSRAMPAAWSLILASSLFGLVHFASKAYAIVAAAMGLYLGGLFLAQGSLTVPIVTHGVYDLVALLQVAHQSRLRESQAN